MPLGQFANQSEADCRPPLLTQALYSQTGGYQNGRYCQLGNWTGTDCCFPCPIQDWLYPPKWQQQLRVANYLSILSVILCCFLLLSFAVLPPEHTHRHYLSVGLLFPVLFISLSFAIPVSTNPSLCYDAITPNDMYSSQSCAWTGSLVTLGGLGSVIWVFLRSLWLHIRIFWDRDPGKRFKWGSIVFGTLLPLVLLIAVLASTGFSYRMGQTCLPNPDNAIATFWIWLVIFAILAFFLQTVTTVYCFFIYVRTLRRERRASVMNSFQHRHVQKKMETWSNVRRLFLLQWRNILVSIFVIIGSISFFVVFWAQDSKLGRVFNDPNNIVKVKTWVICQILSIGDDKAECRKYVQSFTISQAAVLISLILASLVGIEIFILLFRLSMITAWAAFFRRTFNRISLGRPPTPQLTSLENPEKYLSSSSPAKQAPYLSAFSADTSTTGASATVRDIHDPSPVNDTEMGTLEKQPTYERVTSETGLVSPPAVQRFQSFFDHTSFKSESNSGAVTPVVPVNSTQPASRRLSQIQPFSEGEISRSYTPSRIAPSPPAGRRSGSARNPPLRVSMAPTEKSMVSTGGLSIQRTNSSKVRGRISAPLPASFVHVDGAFMAASDSRAGTIGGEAWNTNSGSWENGSDEQSRSRRASSGV